MSIGIIGAGAFGTALAVAMAGNRGGVTLWARDEGAVQTMQRSRVNPRLPGVTLPPALAVSASLDPVFRADVVLLTIPAQTLRGFLSDHRAALAGKRVVAACKGIDLETMTGPVATIRAELPGATAAILTGPSFAADIARGLPTALTLACEDEAAGEEMQEHLSTPALRLYRTGDTLGAELGGALKNVMAIAAGAAIGAGYGDSARAALITRGMAEMQRLAETLGAKAETLMGLSGFGDLVLTCTSDQSRNFRLGLALGRGEAFDPTVTVEGAATAKAVSRLAKLRGLDLPITQVVAAMVTGKLTPDEALKMLLSRPLKEE